ncbi:MAG: hypothetical protein FWD28_09140 [Treponema sp.]|nr:hypothetical protein [Treponema sp.]
MEQRIHVCNVENSPAVCFDTGLEPRSFARTKISESLTEEGYVVKSDGSFETWKPAGVNETNGKIRVYGPLFTGKRFDLILKEADSSQSTSQQSKLQQSELQRSESQQAALTALSSWIRAKMFLGEKRSALNPGASFIGADGSVFFAPEHLSNRCLYIEGTQLDHYNCPDLTGMDTAAFCAGIILYKILTGSHPYPSSEIFQDMREGVFLPLNLAAPDLDDKLSLLIQSALLLPVEKKRTVKNSMDILLGFLEVLTTLKQSAGSSAASSPIAFKTITPEAASRIEKEKKVYLLKQKIVVNTKRFVSRNRYALGGVLFGLLFVIYITATTMQSHANRPTTKGLNAEEVVSGYYEAFSSLNHPFMQACINGADKSDLHAAAGLFAIVRTRQAYERTEAMPIIQARVWKELGGELPAPNVFGVTDLKIENIGGNADEGSMIFRVDYNLWSPDESHARIRDDILTLRLDRYNNWRIVEIIRRER